MVMYGIAMNKIRRIIIPESLQKKALDQPHINHIGIKHGAIGMQVHLLEEHRIDINSRLHKTLSLKLLGRSRKSVKVEIFPINNQ